jgi:anti-sigma-K factor RskA
MRYRRDRQRRRAARHVLDHPDPASIPAAGEDRGLADEIAAIRALTTLLSEIPAHAWPPTTTPDPTPTPARAPHHRPARSRALASAAALACLAAGFTAGALTHHHSTPPSPPPAATATLKPLPGHPPTTTARVQLTRAGRIIITITRLPPPPTGHFYEAWLMSTPTHLIPVASFRPNTQGHARIETSLPAPVNAYRYIDISLQHTGTSPTHSNDSVLRGPTAPLTNPP